MLRSYITVSLRNLRQNAGYTAINVTGLSIGIGCCIAALLFIQRETSWDTQHENVDQIYRVILADRKDVRYSRHTDGPLGAAMVRDFPEVVNATRMWNDTGWVLEQNNVVQTSVCSADPSIYDIMTLPFVHGGKERVFQHPHSAAITEDLSIRLFGTTDIVGRTITVESRYFGGD